MKRSAVIATLCLVAGLAGPAGAQDEIIDPLRNALRDASEQRDLGTAFMTISVFGATPGVAGARLSVGDSDADNALTMSTLKGSPYFELYEGERSVRPYFEGTGSWLRASEDFSLDLTPEAPTTIELDFTSLTALGGAGLAIDLSEHWVLRPILQVGWTSISDDADIDGPFSAEVEEAGDGILFDMEMRSWLYGGALELEYNNAYSNGVDLQIKSRYNHLYTDVYDASDPVLETDGDFGIANTNLQWDGPLDATLFNRDLRWILFGGGTWLQGDQEEVLGFSWFAQAGAGLEIVAPNILPYVEGGQLKASYIAGDNVTGWTFGGSLVF